MTAASSPLPPKKRVTNDSANWTALMHVEDYFGFSLSPPSAVLRGIGFVPPHADRFAALTILLIASSRFLKHALFDSSDGTGGLEPWIAS